MWVARDKDGRLGLFTDKPFRGDGNHGSIGRWCSYTGWYMEISNYYHFNISWEDEPIEVDLCKKP